MIKHGLICGALFLFLCSGSLFAGLAADSTKSSQKKINKEAERLALKESHSRYLIKLSSVYATLDTKISFELPNEILSANLGLENNLGLPRNSFFITGSFIYRINPNSGLYSSYYGINRNSEKVLEKDLIFQNDTIPAGTESIVHFNTQVISLGYLLSVLKDPKAFLGAYFNLYFIMLDTGIYSDVGNVDLNVTLNAPLPNLGLVAFFELNKWLSIDGNIGFFALKTDDFGGNLYSFSLSLVFKANRWLGFNASYQEFDIKVYFPSDEINTHVEYNFRGPALGLSLTF